ncbi:MAG TPA: endoproteinase ArgC [Ramlibacter sp.]|nr:endoproteinase ArgC [Ramlibacter sp.]
MKKKYLLIHGGLAGLLAMALAACGGGGGGGATPLSGPSIPNESLPRIEPYESAAVAPKALEKLATQAGAVPDDIALGAPEAGFGATAPAPAGAPRKIGQARAIAALADVPGMRSRLHWQATAGGGLAAAARIRSNGAASLRVALLVRKLPAGATVRVFAKGQAAHEVSASEVLATLERDARGIGASAKDAGIYWLPTVQGDAATLEIELPPGVDPAGVEVAAPRLLHQWVNVAKASDALLKIGEAGSCNVDATCVPDYSADARSVARMEFVSNDTAFLCTGTLMADAAKSGTPYFFSANHCLGTQAAASTLVTYWFYRASGCNSGVLDTAATQLTGGATLLYAAADTDTSFMRLLGTPPAGAYFAGSLLGPATNGTPMAALHHPRGDLLKLSLGVLESYATCDGDRCSSRVTAEGSNFMALRWSSGTTESGSSGSASFAPIGARRYVTGHLFAGLSSCARPDQLDYYGRFDLAYQAALRQYLGTP